MAQNFTYDPFAGTQLGQQQPPQPNVTLNPSQQPAAQPQASAPPPPQPQQPMTRQQKIDELPDTVKAVVEPDPERPQYERSQYRGLDPLSTAPEEVSRFDEYYRNPNPELDLEQEDQIAKAKVYLTSDGRKLGFPDIDLTNTQKKRLMYANDGVAVNVTADDGSVPQEGDKLAMYELYPAQQYREEFTTPQAEVGALPQALRATQRGLLGPVGVKGDLANLDAGLKAIGLSQSARTFYLRGFATNEFDLDSMIVAPGSDMVRFALSLPAYAKSGLDFIERDVAVPFISGFLMGNDTKDQRTALTKFYSEGFLNYEIPSYAQSVAKEYDVLPEVVEYMLLPRGAVARAGKILVEEIPFYSGAFLLRLGGAMRQFPMLDKYVRESYGGSTFVEALQEAGKKGKAFEDIMQEYLGQLPDKYAREKVAKSLDLAMSLRIARPGSEERALMVRDSVQRIDDQITGALEDVATAKRANNKDGVARAKQRIKNLQEQKLNLESGLLVPKYLADASREMKGTVAAVTASTTVLHDFFGMDPENQPIVEMGAVLGLVVIPGMRRNEGEPTIGEQAKNGVKTVVSNIASVFQAFSSKGELEGLSYSQRLKKLRESKALSREAKNALNEVLKLPGELQQSFLSGVEEAAVMRRHLIKLSAETGVDIDADAFVENLAVLSDIGSLVTLSRNIQDKVIVTDLDKMHGQLLQHELVINAQEKLVSQMAESLQKLLDAQIVGSKDADVTEAVTKLTGMMQSYVARSAEQLANDQRGINMLTDTASESIGQLILSGTASPSSSEPAISSAMQLIDTAGRAAGHYNVSQRAIDGVLTDPEQALKNAAESIDRLRGETTDIIKDLTSSLSVEDARSGVASTVFTAGVGIRKARTKQEVDKRYADFDTKHPNVRANVAGDLMDSFISDKYLADLNEYAIEEINAGALKLAGKDMSKGVKKGFLALFNDGAKEGIERVIRNEEFGMGAESYDKIMDTMGMLGASPIKQVMALRTLFDKTDDASKAAQDLLVQLMGPQNARNFGNAIPILMSTASWRTVNKVLHKMRGKEMRKEGGGNTTGLSNLIDRWEMVGVDTLQDGSPNPLAFRTGWGTNEEPQVVASGVYEEFRGIQTFFREEYANVFYYDKSVRKLHDVLTRGKQNVAKKISADIGFGAKGEEGTLLADIDEWDISTFAREFRGDPRAMAPHNTLDDLFGSLLDSPVTYKGESLLSELELPLAKSVGVYDSATKRHYIIVDSELPEDRDLVALGQATSTLFTRWLQGKLTLTKGGQHALRKNAQNGDIFKELDKEYFEYNEAGFLNFSNVQTYRRKKDGTLEPVGFLVDQEEAFSATTIDMLEMKRGDLRGNFEQARETLNGSWKRDAKNRLAQYSEQIEAENNFISNFGRSLGVGPEGSVSNVEVVSQAIFDAVTKSDQVFRGGNAGTPGLTLQKVRKLLSKEALDADVPPDKVDQFIDEVIQRAVIKHISGSATTVTGKKYTTILEDGTVIRMPSLGMDGKQLLEALGQANPEVAGRLQQVLGDKYDTLVNVGNVLTRMQQDRVPGIDGKLPGLSLDSILSRIYNINREVVSTQWVATEMLIRASRQHGGKLLQAMLTDPKVAKEILDIVETGKIPKYKTQPDWLRALTYEIARQEAVNDDAVTRNLTGIYMSTFEIERMPDIDMPRTPGTPSGGTLSVQPQQQAPDPDEQVPQLTPLQQQARRLGFNPLN